VIHQFLGSLPSQPWETDSHPDFTIWYSSNIKNGHSGAVEAYLTALFVYFERVARATTSDGDSDYPIIFTLRTGVDGTPKDILLGPMTVVYEPSPTTAPAFLGIPDGACVISANKNVGFGQSASQEEMHVGCSPECCPIVLFTPTLRDKEVLVVQGPEAMVAIKGYGRDARVDEFQAGQHLKWARRTMLFMDALELDWYDNRDQLPDLLPGNVDRELCKAYTAFSSRNDAYSHIVTGLWGCRSFGGNSDIKTLIQWCAASMAGVPLHFVCAGADQQDFASQLARIVEHGRKHAWRAESILGHLRALRPDNARARSVFAHLMQSLDNRN
jgi:poly(ADP-ribose) glycohydrolase